MRRSPRARLQLLDPIKPSPAEGSTAENTTNVNNEFEQSSFSADHIKMQMQFYGVYGGLIGVDETCTSDPSSRLEVVPRVSKEEHIRRYGSIAMNYLSLRFYIYIFPVLCRQGYGDLFLDTVVYGAHSTATDALRAV